MPNPTPETHPHLYSDPMYHIKLPPVLVQYCERIANDCYNELIPIYKDRKPTNADLYPGKNPVIDKYVEKMAYSLELFYNNRDNDDLSKLDMSQGMIVHFGLAVIRRIR